MAMVDRKRLCSLMWNMHNVMTALSDENLLFEWYSYGIPDGTERLDELEDLFSLSSDEKLVDDFYEVSDLFVKLIISATNGGFKMWIC